MFLKKTNKTNTHSCYSFTNSSLQGVIRSSYGIEMNHRCKYLMAQVHLKSEHSVPGVVIFGLEMTTYSTLCSDGSQSHQWSSPMCLKGHFSLMFYYSPKFNNSETKSIHVPQEIIYPLRDLISLCSWEQILWFA